MFCNGFLVTSRMWDPGAFEKTKNTIFSHRSKQKCEEKTHEKKWLVKKLSPKFFHLLSPSTLPISRTFLSSIAQEITPKTDCFCVVPRFLGNLKNVLD